MEEFSSNTRLRTACDACHKLKRRCTGAMPCENCASLGYSCIYSVAGRLGRPRGSRSRRNLESPKSPSTQTQKSGSTLGHDHSHHNSNSSTSSHGDPAKNQFHHPMQGLSSDGYDPNAAYKLSKDPTQTPDGALSLFSASEVGSLQSLDQFFAFDGTTLSQDLLGTTTPLSMSPIPMQFEPQQPHPHEDRSQSWSSSRNSPHTNCQCIANLASLLHNLKHSRLDKPSPARLDNVLSRVSIALSQWSAFAACPHCQSNEGEDDDGGTLLIAALSMRRVVSQLKAAGCRGGMEEFHEAESEETDPQLHIGAFQVTGSDRDMLLGVLRTIMVRKLDAAITAMQSMLRSKQERGGDSDTAVLLSIESVLDDLAKTIKNQ